MLKQVFIVVRHRGFHNDGCYEVTTPLGDMKISHYEVVGVGDSIKDAECILDLELSLDGTPIDEDMPDKGVYHTGKADEYMIIPSYVKSDVNVDDFCSNLMN